MTILSINDPLTYLAELGHLHDVEINKLSVDIEHQMLDLVVDDINANFTDLPENPGRMAAMLRFGGVTSLFLDLDLAEGLRISSASVTGENANFQLDVEFNIGYGRITKGRPPMTLKFKTLAVHTTDASGHL